MSLAGLNWQTWTLRLGAGQNQKTDPRALESPELAKAIDVQFDQLGGLQTRYPFADLGSDIAGGGALSDVRRVVENGPELVCYTKDSLYSWNAQQSNWMLRGTHLAVKVDQQPRFVTTGDQVDCDRAELGGTVVYAWTESVGSTSLGYVAAVDKTTGSVVMAPTALPGTASRLRLTALSTKILLSFYDGMTGLYCYALDPTDPSAALAGSSTTLTNSSFGTYYDIVRVAETDQAVFACRRSPATSYLVGTVMASLTVSTSVKARVCDGPIAVSVPPGGASVQVVRSDDTGGGTSSIVGDLITVSSLADVYTAQAIGTAASSAFSLNQIAAAHRSVQDGGQYRCYVFWSYDENTGATDFQTKSNWVDTGNTLGTQATFMRRLGIASRAFDHDGRVFVWLAFSGESSFSGANYAGFRAQLQNSYFLYRDDTFLTSRAVFQKAGGFASSTGRLPGVASTATNEYAWCGTERRVIDLGPKQSGYAARAPVDITFAFDSDEARRCARLGDTLYIAGSEVLQYDGQQLVEVGFHIYPWYFGAIEVATGNLADGTYAIQNTLRWPNARGETDRSTTATTGTVTIAAGPNGISIPSWSPLYVTHKTGIAVEVWRTAVNPGIEVPLYLVSSKDPTATTNPNRYIENDTTAALLPTFNDELADADLTSLESSPENGGTLESLAPPPATIIIASNTRLFLAGVAGDPDRVWYSKQRNDGEVAAFHDALTIPVPPAGGDITALALHQDTLVVFREHAIYALPGEGYDNTGGGLNYGPARLISSDIGAVNHESVAVTDRGTVFKSSKGWYLLAGWGLQYIGGGVSDYDDETPLAVQVLQSQHQVRALTSARMIVFDTLVEPWRVAEWTVADGVHACMWRGTHVYASSAAVKQQQTTYTGVDYGMDVETAWIKLGDLQNYGKVDHFLVLGEYRSAHSLRIRCARDYWKDGEGVYFQDKTWTVSPTTVGARESVKRAPSIKQVEAIKIRITATGATGEALKLTGLSFELGFERGLNRMLPAAQRQ